MTETKDVQEGEADKVDLEQLATYVAELIRGGYLIEAWGEIDRALFVYDGPVQIEDSATAVRTTASEPPISSEAIITSSSPSTTPTGE
jgi:hypothetical protein